MRYILFNIAVAAALIYLFNGGELTVPDFRASLERAKTEISALHTSDAPTPTKPILLAKEGKGHGRDTIGEPTPTPKPQPRPTPTPKPRATNPMPKLPPLDGARQIAKRPTPKPAPKGVAAAITVPPVPPAPPAPTARATDPISQRRAEVLAQGPTPAATQRAAASAPSTPVALKAGTALMSVADRRRALDALAEEMEMLYIEKIGG